MTITNTNNDLQDAVLAKISSLYASAHGHEASPEELAEFIKNTIGPLMAKMNEIKQAKL